jgi:hypothetical protein
MRRRYWQTGILALTLLAVWAGSARAFLDIFWWLRR